jgi:hypothetical protein
MKEQAVASDTSSVFLTGAILLANMDYSGLMDYALRAAIGGVIWMAFKIGSDWIGEKMKNKKQKDQ